jgi:DNA polymerase III delta subunit
MVAKSASLYLLAGQDSPAKDAALEQIKQACLPAQNIRDFNFDTLYGREITVAFLQEKLLFLPLEAGNRLVVIRHCQDMKADVKEYLIEYCRQPHPVVTLVLEFSRYEQKDKLITALGSIAQMQVFKQDVVQNVFDLARMIEAGKSAESLRLLNQLLHKGEKPEMIMGGLRSSLTRSGSPKTIKTVNQLLLQCDVTVKTGSLKPTFALERLVVTLCSLRIGLHR